MSTNRRKSSRRRWRGRERGNLGGSVSDGALSLQTVGDRLVLWHRAINTPYRHRHLICQCEERGASSSCRGRRAAWSHGVAFPGRFDLRVPSTNLLSHSPSQRHHQNSQLISATTTAAPQGAGRWAPGGSGARRLICRRWKNRSSFSPIAWDAGGHGQGLRRATAETAFVVTRPASGDA